MQQGGQSRRRHHLLTYGAVVQAAIPTSDASEMTQNLLDVASLLFGIETVGGVMALFIGCNATILKKMVEIMMIYSNNQPSVLA